MNTNLQHYNPEPDCLRDRCILITGANGGLGSALSLHAASLGATVILAGRNVTALEKIYDDIESTYRVQPAIFPINQETATQHDYFELANTLKNEFGRLDGLTHCSAQLGMPTQIENYPVETWDAVMSVNLHSTFLLTRALMPLMNSTENASIVFNTDDRSTAFWGAYGASKAALTTLAAILADEVEGKCNQQGHPRVAVNTVNPGPMRTRLRATSFAGELPSESPQPKTKTTPYIYLLERKDPLAHGQLIRL